MTYKLIGENRIDNPLESFLENRGIKNIKEYTNLDESCVIPYSKLDNMQEAVALLMKHIEINSIISILVDPDADGYSSAAMLWNYIKKAFSSTRLEYILHSGKQHGLSPDIKIHDGVGLVILPDGGTNDTEQCKELSQRGTDVLILDHHIRDKDNPYAVIVNNQTSPEYSNKEFCGAGIVYKFLQSLDDECWNDYANEFLDLVALANISDVMDMRSYETKYLVEKGLHQVRNKAFTAFAKAQEYSIGNHLNINATAFYITPLINAMCRCGDSDEKELLFRAFIETEEIFKYKKRGEKEETDESIYDRAVRLCKNAKTRQNKAVQKCLPSLKSWIEEKQAHKNPVIFARSVDVPDTFTGLVAMKLADYYKRPCLVLRKRVDGTYGGSARNNDTSPVADLKEVMCSLNLFDFCQGHNGAFGFGIKPSNVVKAINACAEQLSYLDFDTIPVDFELDYANFNTRFIRDINSLKDYFGTGLKEPKVVIKNIILQKNQGIIMGKDSSTWKFITDDNIAFIRFKNSENDVVLSYLNDKSNLSKVIINAICRVSINSYMGVLTPQAEIIKYEVV